MTADPSPFPYDRREHEAAAEAWRQGRLERLTAPDSWLSLIGRFALGEGTSAVGSAEDAIVQLPADRAPARVGSFERSGARVRFTPAADVVMTLRGRHGVATLAPGVPVEVKTDRDGPIEKLALGEVTLEVTEQPAGMFVRVRDPDSAARREFAGIEHFPVSAKWRVVARLERLPEGHVVELGYEGGSVERCEAPGAAVFEMGGVTHRVEPVFTPDRKRLYLVFRDETARDATYGAGRFLYAPLPVADQVLLDFNQAFSPPCAFTPYSACPLTPFQNRLALRIEAGEKYRAP
jgi:uncharacterized protein (DUF1684 family)